MQISHPSSAPDYYKDLKAGVLRTGTLDTKVLAVGKEGALDNYRMSIEASGQDEWKTPRHRHNFDQIRLQLEGEWSLTEDIMMLPGMVYYFPESVHYGPQLGKFGSKTLNIQFGGASRNGFNGPKARREGYEAMIKRGIFEKGSFTWIDEKGQRHRQDAAEATWEQIRGRKVSYSPPRYDCVAQMNPANYEWIKDTTQSGIARKLLGSFTENNMQVGFIRVDAGASLTIGKHTAAELFFVVNGSVSHGGNTHGVYTAIALEPGEGPIVIKAVEQAELYNVRLPTFNG